jgi:hypothetical protein
VIDLRLLSVEEVGRDEPADRAAVLRWACGHVTAHVGLLDAGYRFYPMGGGEIPHLLNKRFSTGDGRTGSITLLATLDPRTGRLPLEGCTSPAEARRALADPSGPWLVHLTVGWATVGWSELTGSLGHRDPAAFAVASRELLALPLAARRDCALCAA